MIDAGKLLRGLMNGGMARKGGGAMLMGGLALAAFEHFSEQRNQTRQPPPAPVPPAGNRGSRPPPPPSGAPQMAAPPPIPDGSRAAGPATPPPVPSGPTMAPAAASMPGEEEKALLLVKAMIAAAKADGEIDAAERAAILAHVDEQDAEARAFVEAELQKPLDLYEITSRVRDEATAREVYAASFLAIEVDTPAERGFLDRLAARLGLEPAQAAEIETRLEADAG